METVKKDHKIIHDSLDPKVYKPRPIKPEPKTSTTKKERLNG